MTHRGKGRGLRKGCDKKKNSMKKGKKMYKRSESKGDWEGKANSFHSKPDKK